jgi:CBS domain-containing protein
MGSSEFDEAYEDDDEGVERQGAEQRLGEAVLGASIRALDPRPAVMIDEETPIAEAIRLMLEHRIGALLVMRGGKAVGIFTERDVLLRVASPGADQSAPVKGVMTPDPESLGLDDGIAFALNRMIIGGFRHVPIVDDAGTARAVLSLREVVAFIVAQLPARVLNLPPEPTLEARSTDVG